MGGILKNPLALSPEQLAQQDPETLEEFRRQVYENTQKNAKLTSNKRNVPGLGYQEEEAEIVGTSKRSLPKDVVSLKHEHDMLAKMTPEEQVQWNQMNLAENEITKQQFQDIHIDEPKTPYQGAVDPHGEYYKVDDDEDDDNNTSDKGPGQVANDDIDDLSLGEPEYEIKENKQPDIEMNDENDEDSSEARHKKFEELRKKHYDVRAIFNGKAHEAVEDEDEDRDDTRPKEQ
ncbi:PP1-complex regulatory subunit GLC8 [Saccharomyces eubayanus]|uniref:PP1-complex regulatory subunit GLC8 n=1 Tax=Saccharomyces eubayanus TaxID=1080349 RepID=UPI0006C54492|nr:GLC8-like protein [Saccharomyces eubayanus]KOG97641.1 GLC8-like protein [Saccharomyces eubayanus]